MRLTNRTISCSILSLFFSICANAQHSPTIEHRPSLFGKVPAYFEENHGQADARALYIARAGDQTAFVTSDGLVLALKDQAVAMHLVDADPRVRFATQSPLEGVSNYYLGRRAFTGLQHFSAVRAANIRPNIDIVYHANGQNLEYDLVIHAGGNPAALQFRFDGGAAPELDQNGDLVFKLSSGELRQHAPRVWQQMGDQRREIACRYEISGEREVRLLLSDYDRSRDLVVDPILSYSTYLAGTGSDAPLGIAVDSTGFAYVTGYTTSLDFPATAGALRGYSDAFVSKLNATGTALIYSTFIGGSYQDQANAIAIEAGNAYITGFTYSFDFPFTSGAAVSGPANAFVVEVNASGSLVYATGLGGNGYSVGTAIAVDTTGTAYAAGSTQASNFPVTTGALKTTKGTNNNAFVAKVNASGQVVFATYLGGTGNDSATAIAVDPSGNTYVGGTAASANFPVTKGAFSTVLNGGQDAFVAKLNASGSALIYATFLGGSSYEYAGGLAVDAAGDCFVTGTTASIDFPTTPGSFVSTVTGYRNSWYVTKLNATGTKLVYSTYLLGSPYQNTSFIALNSSGNAFVAGTNSGTFSTTPGALRMGPPPNSYETDVFLVKLSTAGTELNYSTLLGAAGTQTTASGLAFDGKGGIYLTGWTNGAAFPVTATAFQSSAPKPANGQSGFVAKINMNSPALCEPALSPSSINLPGIGGSFSAELTLADGCPWEAVTATAYTYPGSSISLNTPTHGVVGSSPVKLTGVVGQNNNTSQNATLSVSVGSATLTINQAPGSCQAPVLTPPSVLSFDSAGGLENVSLVLPSSCSWVALSSAPWLTVTANSSGVGAATVTVFAGQNSFAARTATLMIDGHPITVKQSGGKCTATAAAAPSSFSATGSTGAISITTNSSTCTWSAYSTVSWIEMVSDFSNGQGSGAAPFIVAPNPGSTPRSASVLIADKTLTITQDAGPAGSVGSFTSSIVAGGGSSSLPNLGDGGPAVGAYLSPSGLAFDSATGKLYIVDGSSARIRVVTPDGNINTFAGGGSLTAEGVSALSAQLFAPGRLAVDPASSVYVTDSYNRVRKIANGFISTFAGQTGGSFGGDNGPATTAYMNGVRQIASDANGNIYIADQNNGRIREVSGGIITTFAGGGSNGLGDGGPAANASLSYPSGVGVDSNQNVYIGDSSNGRVREVSKGTINTLAQVSYPQDIAVDPLGDVFTLVQNAVQWFAPGGSVQYLTECCSVYPNSIAADKSGNVYVSDTYNNVVRKFTPLPSYCSYDVAAPSGKIAGSGATVKISVIAATGCNWTAYSNQSWAPISSGTPGNGNGTVSVTFAPNATGAARHVTLAVADQVITLTQAHE